MNINQLRAEVEGRIEPLAPVDWANPKNLSPLGIGFCNLMAANKILMQPQNQLAMYRNAQRKWLRMWGL